jgi:hypothetical protein
VELRIQSTPPPHGPERFIRRLAAGQRLYVTVLSRSLWGVWTHWFGAKSGPCYRDKKSCDGCKRGFPARWKGFLCCLNLENKHVEFCELTPLAAENLLAQVPKGQSLRGLRLTLERGKGDKARLKCIITGVALNQCDLPKEETPEKTLVALWGTPEIDIRLPASETIKLDTETQAG